MLSPCNVPSCLLLLLYCQLTHPELRKQGDLTCPGCGEAGCLMGGGMRAGHVTVMEVPRQFLVFSFNLEHPGCSRTRLSKTSECWLRGC